MQHAILVHENDGKISAEVFTKRQDGHAAFRKVKSGTVSLYELGRSQAAKRANFEIVHEQAEDSLAGMSEKELRAEAKRRDLVIAGNPHATIGNLISEIQQDELTRRLKHRVPLTSDDTNLNLVVHDDLDEFTVDDLKAHADEEGIDTTGAKVKQDYLDRIRAYRELDQNHKLDDLKALAATENIDVSGCKLKSEHVNTIAAHRRAVFAA